MVLLGKLFSPRSAGECSITTALETFERHTVSCVKCGGTTRMIKLSESPTELAAGRKWPEGEEAMECADCGWWMTAKPEWLATARAHRQVHGGLS